MSSKRFRTAIREKIDDSALQAALNANAERRVQGQISAFESLPDWKQRRQRAHAVRAQVIENHEKYLGKFVTRVQENGIQVHRAKNADEAIAIFLGILRSNNDSPVLVAKSKSMVTEEIGLNHALESHGHRVVETDLGEFIIQMRGERPSHIITPSVHLRRQEVGRLFQEKLGIEYTEDIDTLTEAARTSLRKTFLDADVGVSGVNFGVAESGSLCLVTNEGNGRMVTSLPPVHVAIMGMERLVPSLVDLALMLSLLPRSATTQKISVYTQLIQGPAKGQHKHLILVDNGRSQLLHSPLREALFCIRCGACLNACPVFREIGGHGYLGEDGQIAPYPGPIGSVVSPGLIGENYFQLAQASSLCGACKEACPVDIDLPKLLTRVRAGAEENQGEGLSAFLRFGLQIYTRIAASPGLFVLSQRLSALGARLVSPTSFWMKLPAFTGWGFSKDFPRPAAKPFRARIGDTRRPEDTPKASRGTRQSRQDPLAGEAGNPEKTETPSTTNRDNLLDQFTQELRALDGQVVLCKSNELSGKILSLLKERNIDRVQAWKVIPGLEQAVLTEAGLSVQLEADESIRAGISGALAGIAETGTLVIPGNESRPLSASLLPEIHIAVLRASDILPTLEDALQMVEVVECPATVLVSGPSRTADIEMTLTIGVHGPGELQVFVVE